MHLLIGSVVKESTAKHSSIFRGYLILAIFSKKAKSAKIQVRQYYMQSLIKAQIKKIENLMSI